MGEGSVKKRAASHDARDSSGKAPKRKKLWRTPHPNQNVKRTIESGDAGIFVTCDRGREGKCTAEILDLLSQEIPNSLQNDAGNEDAPSKEDTDDIEAQIRREVECMKPRKSHALFQAVKLDVPCLLFIKVDKTIDPVDLVHRICMDARANPDKKRSRYVKRLTPITSTRKILSEGLEDLANEILKPHFHSDGASKKYAIRPSVRNNHEWPRDTLIRLVARAVGPGHTVNLRNYDALILVEVMQNICGMSVVGGDYDELKRYNLAEIYNPTPRPQAAPIASPNMEGDTKAE
ncbi:hypothetical protein LOZ58_000324 [Ophidiomyces ophidiicola]|nr:hypothetical protein LOZ65_005559 [Ophidiomyces ophidiicola]KAI1934966.1 hypothetical protein LOZ66_005514 [Ophidiomyces ophidiicola]KAI1966835.1 hypothetical protein LOZ58_000324 [Ophidiomyces ophidiicola]